MQAVEWEIGSTSLATGVGAKAIPFWIGHDCGPEIAAHLRALEADELVVIAEPAVWRMYEGELSGAGKLRAVLVEGGEANKTLANVERLAERLIAEGITRRTVLVAMGGGVIGNLTGLAAALLFRGIRFVHVPTTLLAMHDSVTSLKQGVNCGGTKNILGTFHAPAGIFVDLRFLESLPAGHIRAGLAELVKNALVLGGEYAESVGAAIGELWHTSRLSHSPSPGTPGEGRGEGLSSRVRTADQSLPRAGANPELWRRIVELGVAAKLRLMRNDPLERGEALVLEYGHTIGHALELEYLGELNHGEAIAWGMRCAAWVSRRMGLMSSAGMAAHERMVDWLGELPRPARRIDAGAIMARIQRDNKRGYLPRENAGAAAMVLLREPGVVVKSGELPLVWATAEAVGFALGELAGAFGAASL